MPRTRARTATLGAPAPRPTVGVAKRHIARIAYHTHGVKSPLNAHLATPARATVDTHTPPTTAHKKNTRRLAFQATKHIQYASNIYMRVFMRGRRPVARGGPFARGWFYVDRARAREGVLRVIPSIWMWVFKCTTRARWRFARATDRDRKKNPSAGAGCTGDRRRSAMRGVTTPHDRRRPRTTLAQHTNIYSSPCRRR